MKPDTDSETAKVIGDRLKTERLRAGLSAEALALEGGVSRATQFLYEAGTSAPDALYLGRVHRYGLDIQFVITGERALPSGELSPQDQKLLSKLKGLPEDVRSVVDSVALLAELANAPRREYSLAFETPAEPKAAAVTRLPKNKALLAECRAAVKAYLLKKGLTLDRAKLNELVGLVYESEIEQRTARPGKPGDVEATASRVLHLVKAA